MNLFPSSKLLFFSLFVGAFISLDTSCGLLSQKKTLTPTLGHRARTRIGNSLGRTVLVPLVEQSSAKGLVGRMYKVCKGMGYYYWAIYLKSLS